MKSNSNYILPVLAILLLLLGACSSDSGLNTLRYPVSNEDGTTDTVPHNVFEAYPNPRFTMHTGEEFTWEKLKGKTFVADVFFSRCPEICPKMSASMSRLHELYNSNPNVRFLSITVDPEHDTLALLRDYADRYGARDDRWYFVRGPKEEIYKFAHEAFKFKAYKSDSSEIAFIHDQNLMLVDPKGHIRFGEKGFYNGTMADEVELLEQDLAALLKEHGQLEDE